MNMNHKKEYYVAVVVLNYNSTTDLKVSVPQLAKQTNVKLTLILVDNASTEQSLNSAKTWAIDWQPETVIGKPNELVTWVDNHPVEASADGRVFFLLNNENQGYSAGNNKGIQLAEMLGADAVLIANPDMRFEYKNYISEMVKELFARERYFVAASRILGTDGKDQNPLREPSYWEELFWPVQYFSKFIKPKSYIIPVSNKQPIFVPKVSGCCQLIRMSFLKEIGYLDEGVFLYCEEPILSAQVRKTNGEIVFVPSLTAIHAHVRSEKDNASKRMLFFIKSRGYYLENYSNYKPIKLFFLKASYWLLNVLHTLKKINKL